MAWISVLDIVKETASILGISSVLQLPEFGGNSEEGREYVKVLIDCISSCAREVATEYIPLVHEETLVSNGSVGYADLSKPVFEILSVKLDGVRRAFKVFPHDFSCAEGEVVVRYSYLPEKVCSLTDSVEVGYRVTDRLIAYGASANYCLINGQLDNVDLFNFHYTSMIKNALVDNRKVTLPKRRWR